MNLNAEAIWSPWNVDKYHTKWRDISGDFNIRECHREGHKSQQVKLKILRGYRIIDNSSVTWNALLLKVESLPVWSLVLLVLLSIVNQKHATTRQERRANFSKGQENLQMFTARTTRWFKYDRDKLWLVYAQSVPVIFEPPCISLHVHTLFGTF
jgi:hypothetical protein